MARTSGERVRSAFVAALFALIAHGVLYAGILDRVSG